jgi:hypothetical protein
MLLKHSTLVAIANGTVDTAFRRWQRPRVRPGSRIRTGLGVIAVTSVEPTRLEAITEQAARQAGYQSRVALLKELARHPGGRLYRIRLSFGGEDPRLALRARAAFEPGEREKLEENLARLGAQTANGPWALPVLRLIEAHPSIRAAALAKEIGMDTPRFKARVRQLKNLGLTESLDTGYRLSPRGRALLRKFDR